MDLGGRRRRGRRQSALAEREAIDRAAEDREVMYVCGDADDEAGGATTKEIDVDLASSFPGGGLSEVWAVLLTITLLLLMLKQTNQVTTVVNEPRS